MDEVRVRLFILAAAAGYSNQVFKYTRYTRPLLSA